MNRSPPASSFFVRRLPWIVAVTLLIVIVVTSLAFRSRSPATDTRAPTALPQAPAATIEPASPRTSSTPAFRGDAGALLEKRTEQRKAQRTRVQDRVDATNAAFAARFRAEKTDPAWSAGKEQRLAELSTSSQIKDINAGIDNLSVSCKSTVCMVTGDFASTSIGDDWFTLYMNNVGAEVPYAVYKYVPGKDGRVTIQIYAVGRK